MTVYERVRAGIITNELQKSGYFEAVLSPLFHDSLALTTLFIDILERECLVYDDEPLPKHYDVYAENFYVALTVALKNGMDPNEIVPYEDGEAGGDNIMWSVVGYIRRSHVAPKMIKLLLDYGGDPNLKIGTLETVYSEVDFFFLLDGEEQEENLLKCWLLLAAYGGDKDNLEYLPLKMLSDHKQDELKNYENYRFSFETVMPDMYKRTRVLFIIDRQTGEKVAVNDTPFG